MANYDDMGVEIKSAEYHREDYSSMTIQNPDNISKEVAFKDYRGTMFRMMHLVLPELGDDELNRALDYSINKRLYNSQIGIIDSYRGDTFNKSMVMTEMVNYLVNRKPILTSFGCLFTQHGECPNPMYYLIQEFSDRRDAYKKEMFKYEKGSELFNKYNLFQLIAKVDVNAVYGSSGSASAIFYNIYVASSITRQGRNSISSSIMLFEAFLANNIKFGSLNEVIMFIDIVCQEKSIRQFDDSQILDNNVTVEEVFNKLIITCGYNWIPDMIDMDIIWRIVNRLSQEDLNRIYYKNNLYAFMDNEIPTKMIIDILGTLETPFFDPNKPPSSISDKLGALTDVVLEYVFYNHQIIDKIERIERLIREVVIVTDTDSCMINLDPWYRFIEEKTRDYNIPIKNYEVNGIDVMNAELMNEDVETRETDSFYDFYSDEVIERKRKINPVMIIPEDGLRYSIINIIAFIISKGLRKYFDTIAVLHNTMNKEHDFSFLIMKNEFLFKKILLTIVKKHYATYVEVQEGKKIPTGIDTSLDVKGMEIAKSTIPLSTKKALEKILYEDILNCDSIDQLKILNDIAVLEKKILDAIKSGSLEYYKPVKIKSIDSYKEPMTQQAIKASIIYNGIRKYTEPEINLKAVQSNVFVIKVNITKPILENSSLRNDDPDRYRDLMNILETNNLGTFNENVSPNKRIITSIAIPDGIETPKWLLEFIDYHEVIINNIENFPLESVGFTKLNTNTAYSGIVNL